jgi:hypothetical protein
METTELGNILKENIKTTVTLSYIRNIRNITVSKIKKNLTD